MPLDCQWAQWGHAPWPVGFVSHHWELPYLSPVLLLPSPGPWPEFLSLARSLDLLFGPQTRSIFGRGSEPNPSPGGIPVQSPGLPACLPLVLSPRRGSCQGFCQPSLTRDGHSPDWGAGQLPQGQTRSSRNPPPQVWATPFVRMLQRGLQTFPPNCKASKELSLWSH